MAARGGWTAEAWLNDERILIDRGEWTPPKVRAAAARARSLQSITLRDWAERSMVNKTLRASTRERYRRMLDKRILPVLGDIPLAGLTRMDVTSWYMTLSVTLAKEARSSRAGQVDESVYGLRDRRVEHVGPFATDTEGLLRLEDDQGSVHASGLVAPLPRRETRSGRGADGSGHRADSP